MSHPPFDPAADRNAFRLMPEPSLAGDFTVKPGTLLGPRTLDAYELVMFPYGTNTRYESEGGAFTLERPCVTITRPEELHSCRFDPERPVRHLFVVFNFQHAEGREWFGSLLRNHTVIPLPRSSVIPVLFKHLLLLSEKQMPRWLIRTKTLLFSILEELHELAEASGGEKDEDIMSDGPSSHPLQQAVVYMYEHLHEPLSIKSVAARIGWSHTHFTRSFARRYGESPNRYFNRLKMEQAARMLMYDTASVKEIANTLGFANEHYFSRLFKQLKGVPPTEYRERGADPRYKDIVFGNDRDALYSLNHYFTYAET